MLLMCLTWGLPYLNTASYPGPLNSMRSKPLPNGSAIFAIRPYSRILMSRIKRGAQGNQLSDHLVQIFHDEVEVNRRPMALVASNGLLGAKVCKGGAIGKEVDWQVRACQFDPGGAQPPLQRETETVAIKLDAVRKLGHFN